MCFIANLNEFSVKIGVYVENAERDSHIFASKLKGLQFCQLLIVYRTHIFWEIKFSFMSKQRNACNDNRLVFNQLFAYVRQPPLSHWGHFHNKRQYCFQKAAVFSNFQKSSFGPCSYGVRTRVSKNAIFKLPDNRLSFFLALPQILRISQGFYDFLSFMWRDLSVVIAAMQNWKHFQYDDYFFWFLGHFMTILQHNSL